MGDVETKTRKKVYITSKFTGFLFEIIFKKRGWLSSSKRTFNIYSIAVRTVAAADIPLFFPRLTRADQPIAAAKEKHLRCLPERGAALSVVHVGALRHLVVILRVDDTVERAVEFDVNRQTRARALHF